METHFEGDSVRNEQFNRIVNEGEENIAEFYGPLMKETRVFKHVVGRSTLKEGITIHRDFEDYFDSPEAGFKREITLIYDESRETKVTLRRLNNIRKHVQIKYEAQKHSQLRDWLRDVFKASSDKTLGEILEFHRISKDRYLLKPLSIEELNGTNLRISKTLYHGGAKSIVPYIPIFREVPEVINEIRFETGECQAYYNQQLKEGFISRGWSADERVISALNLRYDYRKENVQVEVEFGNARTYYQDCLKFSIAFNEGLISLGALIAPTADFADVLCELGKEKAWQKVRQQRRKRRPTYSGMMSYEKAAREFKYIKFMLNMPIVIIGIDYKDQFSASLSC